MNRLARLITLPLAALLLPMAASAQWQWVDKTGRKVFSDSPPPPDIPDRSILRQPGGQAQPLPALDAAAQPASAASAPVAAASGAARGAAPVTPAEVEKLKREAEASAKRKEDEERLARMRADNCVRARRLATALDSGIRMQTLNDKGEREYMDEAARAAEAQRLRGIMAQDCRPS